MYIYIYIYICLFDKDTPFVKCHFSNINISKSRILPIQKSLDVAAALPRPHDMIS